LVPDHWLSKGGSFLHVLKLRAIGTLFIELAPISPKSEWIAFRPA